MDIFEIILIIIGSYLVTFPFVIKTRDVKNSIFFKVIPFFSGSYCIFYALKSSGVILVIGK